MSPTEQAARPSPPSLSQRIAAELRDDILRGHYRAGERLPSERELADRFAAHRGAVREALKKIEQLGIAEIRPGGARVLPLDHASLDVVRHLIELDSPPDPELFDQIFEVFGGLFSLAARLAAERASPEQRERAREILERLMQTGLPFAVEHELIQDLSKLFTEASDNMILTLVRRGLRTEVIERIEDHETLLRPPEAERQSLLQRVAEMIAAGDGPGASNAVYALTQAVRRNGVALLRAQRDSRIATNESGVSWK